MDAEKAASGDLCHEGDRGKLQSDLDREIEEFENSLGEVNSQLKQTSLRKHKKQRIDRLGKLRRQLFVAEQQLRQTEEKEASEVKVQIISDSIAKYIESIRQTEVTSFPGITINQLADKIRNGH